jgi:membrane associated rhomboid family serine protease
MSTPVNFNGSDATAVSPALQESVGPTPVTSTLQEPPGPSQAVTPRPRVSTTFLLLLVNSLIFSAMLVHSDYILNEAAGDTLVFPKFDLALLRSWGSDYGPLTLTGQFWRVITSTFLHSNFAHLASNMLALWGFGKPLDRLFTRAQMLGIYLLTGTAASIFDLYWDPLANSVGASGAIYGLAGVWIALLAFGRLGLPERTIIRISIWLFLLIPFGLLSGHPSNDTGYAAHAGGIVSGFGIGVPLALTFRRPEAKHAIRQRALLRLATVVLVVAFAAVTLMRRNAVMAYISPEKTQSAIITTFEHPGKSRIARVFLDLKGDPKLVHYFSGLLNAELEHAGIAVAGNEHDADGVLRGELKAQAERINLSMGVVKMYINSQRGLQIIDSCQTLSTAEDSNLYKRSAVSVVSEIRDKYHDARTIRLDPASDLAASPQFAAEFSSELKTSGLTMVQSGPADIALHIDLRTEKIPVEKDEATYDIKVVAPDGVPLVQSSGSGVLSAMPVGNLPAACPERLADLEWIYNTNALYFTARKVTHALNHPAQLPASKPK